MKLVSCHIENYGKLSNVDFDFNSGITEFYLENGEGKTTLASFIKAMFYGLPTYTSSEKTFGERKHYLPFSGGVFGGNIKFEHNGQVYMVERRFDQKSKTRDEIVVYCNGCITSELIDPIGRQLFGLDENSFMRTLFVNSADMDLIATEGISGRLNNYIEGNIDLGKALDILETEAKKYRAARGNIKGIIPESERRVVELQKEIENLETIDKTLEGSYRARAALQTQINAMREKFSQIQAAEVLWQKWNTYDSIKANAKDFENNLEQLMQKYPRGIPMSESVTEAEDTFSALENVKARLSATAFDAEKEERLASLERLFSLGEPSTEELDGVRSELDSIVDKDAYIDTLRRTEPKGRDRELVEKFSKGKPSDIELERMDELESAYREHSRALLQTSNKAENNRGESPEKKGSGISKVAFAIGALMLVGGAMFLMLSLMAGIIVMIIGALSLVGGGFMYLNHRMSAMERSNLNFDGGEAVSIQLKMRETENELQAMLSVYGYPCENGAIADLQRLKNDIETYTVMLESEKKRMAEIDACVSARNASENYVREFLKEYGFDGTDMRRELNELERKLAERHSLISERAKCEKSRENDSADEKNLKAKLDEFFAGYRNGTPQDIREELEVLKKDRSMLSVYGTNLKKYSDKAQEYFEKEELKERPQMLEINSGAIEEELEVLRERLTILDGQISEDESKTAKLNERRDELERLFDDIEEYKEKHKLLKGCAALLEKADTNLTERYISPIRDSFSRYAKMIEDSFGERVTLDKDFFVRFEKNGAMRDHKHLSTGQRAVWALCLRLAFIDQLFDDDFPFMVLDDPFMALDASNMNGVAELVRTLSKERQLIYFYCHESRKIN